MSPRPSLLPGVSANALAEQIQEKSAEVTLAVFRLAKNAMLHSMDNDAAVEAIARAEETLSAFGRDLATGVTLTFTDETVFVSGQLLRASRGVYDSAVELGKILARAEVAEVAFERELPRESLRRFGRELSTALRDPSRRTALLEADIPHVTSRGLGAASGPHQRWESGPPVERAIRFYATALVVMRRFYEDVALSRRLVPHRVKRLAQRLVVLTEEHGAAMVAVSALAAAHRDDAARAVQSAIMAVLLARHVTTDRHALVRLALAALLSGSGRVRLEASASSPTGGLSDEAESRVPAVAALFAVATGGVNPPSAERAVTVHEAAWLERRALLGPSPLGEPPLPQAEILAFVQELSEHLAPRDARPALSPAEALDGMAARPGTHPLLMRLMLRTLGVVPAGSVVELASGEWAVVVGTSSRVATLPVVRIVTDARGHALATPATVDLAEPAAPQIRRLLSSKEARFNVARAFL